MCRTTIIFGTLKDDSLKINSLALNNCFSHRNIFQNGINTLSKMVNHFLSKSSKFCIVWTIRFCSNFTIMWSKYLSNNVWHRRQNDFQSEGGQIFEVKNGDQNQRVASPPPPPLPPSMMYGETLDFKCQHQQW